MEIKFLAHHVVDCLLLPLTKENRHAPDGRAIALMTLNDTFRKNWVPFAVLIEIGWLSSYLGIISVVMVIYPGFAPIV